MKIILSLPLYFALFIFINLKAQDTLHFGKELPFYYYISDSSKVLISSYFEKRNINDTIEVYFINEYQVINLRAYDDSLNKMQTKQLINNWLQVMRVHEFDKIDTNYMKKNNLSCDTVLLAFFTYPFKDYLLVEFYQTIKYHGYRGSKIIKDKRLQILYKYSQTNELEIVRSKVLCKQNKLLFLDEN